jgi:hypothetical protein
MRDDKLSRSAAARKLAEAGEIEGVGSPPSRAKRLAERYRRELERSKP